MNDGFTRIDSRLIKVARKSRKMSQAQLASMLGKSQSCVSAIEKGTTQMSMQLAESLFGVFGTDIVCGHESDAIRKRVKRRLDNADDEFIEWLDKTLNLLKT